MADAERLEIRHDRGRVVEAELRRELQRDRSRAGSPAASCVSDRPIDRPWRQLRGRRAAPDTRVALTVDAGRGRSRRRRLASRCKRCPVAKRPIRAEHVAVALRRAEAARGRDAARSRSRRVRKQSCTRSSRARMRAGVVAHSNRAWRHETCPPPADREFRRHGAHRRPRTRRGGPLRTASARSP